MRGCQQGFVENATEVQVLSSAALPELRLRTSNSMHLAHGNTSVINQLQVQYLWSLKVFYGQITKWNRAF